MSVLDRTPINQARPVPPRCVIGSRRGLTLLESLIAAGILLIAVVAVSSAVTAGQQHAFDAQLRIAGAIAAEDLIARLGTVDYSDLRDNWDGYEEAPGEMRTQQGRLFPAPFNRIGRRVTVSNTVHSLTGLATDIHGVTVEVEAFDDSGQTLATIPRFIPQPAFATIPGIGSDQELDDGDYMRDTVNAAPIDLNDSNAFGGAGEED